MKFVRAITILGSLLCVPYMHGQNGPTKPSATLTWTQSVTPGVTGNCIYRGSASGVYTFPALSCSSSPSTSFTDNTVQRGNTYYYAVTAKFGATESGYSNEVVAVFPIIAPPTGVGAQETKLQLPVLREEAPVTAALMIYPSPPVPALQIKIVQ